VLAYAALFGFGIALGPLATLWSPIILTAFGQENATATVGLLNVSTAGFALVAPTGASVLHRVTGGWVVPLVALGIVTILGQASSTAGLARPECNGQPTIHI